MTKIYEVFVVVKEVRKERISAESVDDLRARVAQRDWILLPGSVPREIERYEVRP